MGGPTTFYQGIGEVDILKGISEVKRLFSVDPDRVYIMGHSMGGAGSYTVGLHYPDHFGGIMALDPAMGLHIWEAPVDMPKWMRPQVDIVVRNAGEQHGGEAYRAIAAIKPGAARHDLHLSESRESDSLRGGLEREIAKRSGQGTVRRLDYAAQPDARFRAGEGRPGSFRWTLRQ